jgi:hypothetical protein
MEDVQCSAIPIRPLQHLPPLHDWILRRLCTHRHCTYLHTAAFFYKLLAEHMNSTGRPWEKSAKISKPHRHHTTLATVALQAKHTLLECSQPASGFLKNTQARANFHSVSSLPRPTRSRVVLSSRLVCTYIYKATECELAPLMSQISNVHPATLS